MYHVMWIIGMGFAACAGWMDWRTRRIPNWLTLSGTLGGLALNAAFWGWAGVKTSLLGLGVALGILLPMVLIRGLGAGDWKLMGALGSLLGWGPVLLVLLATSVLAGLLAFIQAARHKRLLATFANLWELLKGFLVYGLHPHPAFRLDNPRATTIPFGVAAAVGTGLCYGALMVHVGKLPWG